MESPEVPIEEVQEHIHHHAHGHGHGDGHAQPERWTMGVALSTALFAALAAIASLIAGGMVNEAMVAQIKSSDTWGQYQAKSIKENLLVSKDELLTALGHEAPEKDGKQHEKYESEKKSINAEATALGRESEDALAIHEQMAHAVTMFQVAISLAAIAVLTKRKLFWMIGLGLGAVGVLFFSSGLIHIRAFDHERELHAEAATSTSEKPAEQGGHAEAARPGADQGGEAKH
jgi:hypothetical protein